MTKRGKQVTFDEYQTNAQRTSPAGHDRVLNGVMGLNGEAGECIDIMKKYMFQGHKLDWDKLIYELGDVLWYVAETATGLGASMDEIAARNNAKLRARYPDGFDAERSINREDDK